MSLSACSISSSKKSSEKQVDSVGNGTKNEGNPVYYGAKDNPSDSIDEKEGSVDTSSPKGITVNKIKFETLSPSALPNEIKELILKYKTSKGFIFKELKGKYYIVVFAGEKPTKAHRIKVQSVEDNEGKTYVLIEEIKPQQGEIANPEESFPFVVIQAPGITQNITVKDAEGKEYNKLIN